MADFWNGSGSDHTTPPSVVEISLNGEPIAYTRY